MIPKPRPASSPAMAYRLLLAGSCSILIPALMLGLGLEVLCPGGTCQVTGLDREILAAFNALRGPELDLFFQAVTWLGSLFVLVPACLFLAWRLKRRRPAAALGMVLSLAGASLFAWGAKQLVGRPRPDLFPFLPIPADLSFPSGHAMQVTGFALGWLLFARERRSWESAAGAAILIALVAASRVYLQVHFPTDVLAGIGAAAGLVVGLRLFPFHWRGERAERANVSISRI